MSIDIVEALPGMELGRGYDLLKSDPKILTAVNGKTGKLDGSGGQVSAEYNFSIVDSVSDFQQALGVDVSMSVNMGLAGGSMKTSFEEKCKVTSEATFCLVSFKAINAPVSLRGNVRLDDEAMELLALKDKARFRQRYGTHFCSDIFTGVEFIGSVRIMAETQEQEMEIAASINARYGLSKGSASVEHSSSSSTSRSRIEIFTYQSGGIMRPVNSLEELFETGKRVAKQGAKGLATPTQVVLGSYDELELPLDGVSAFAQKHAQKEMRRLKRLYDQLRQDRNNIDFVLANPDKYVRFDKKQLKNANTRITKSLKHIIDLSDQCAQDFSSYKAQEPDVPVVELPERKQRRRRTARVRQENLRLRARNKEQRAKILAEKAEDLKPGAKKTRLKKEIVELKREASELRQKARKLAQSSKKGVGPAKKKVAKKKAAKKRAAKKKPSRK
jgi:hypothetical protein